MGLRARADRLRRELRKQHPALRRAYLLARLDARLPRLRGARFVHAATGVPGDTAARLLDEPRARRIDAVVAAAERDRGDIPALGTQNPYEGHLLYAIVRALRPSLVVETGVASGSSSAYVLAALEENGTGRLISIDLPFVGIEREAVVAGTEIGEWDASPIPVGREPGWIVPQELRSRWDLRLGDARELLPAIDEPIDLFFHDSLHQREHMLFEFRTVWPRLRQGGVLLADDVFQQRHDALPSFADEVGRPYRIFRHVGLVLPQAA